MNSVAGANPEASTITEVIFRLSQEAAQTGPVGVSDREFGGEVELAGLVEGLAARDEPGHGILLTWLNAAGMPNFFLANANVVWTADVTPTDLVATQSPDLSSPVTLATVTWRPGSDTPGSALDRR